MGRRVNISRLNGGISVSNPFYPIVARSGKVTPNKLKNYLAPIQFARLAHDIGMWRESIKEAELAFNPMRVKMQRMYMDTIINPDIFSLYEKRMELVTQRDYKIFQIKDGKEVISNDLTQQIKFQSWFEDYIKYTSEAEGYGYSLINLGDIVDDKFPFISITPRENIRPDGTRDCPGVPVLTGVVYSIDGIHVTEDPLIDMTNHYISTPTERGASVCGYGYMYKLAYLEIHIRHVLEWNLDFAQDFGQPIKKGFTNKTGDERDDFEDFLRSSSSNSWALLDRATNDDITYEHAQSVGTAWKTYDNLEERLLAKGAQLLLGHSDAMKSTAGKLGGFQTASKSGDNITVVQQALNSKQISAGNFVSRKINEIAAPRFRKLGKYVGSKLIENLIPDGYYFGLLNDKEEDAVRNKKIDYLTKISTFVSNMNKGGYNCDPKELSDLTGMTITAAEPTTVQIRENTTTIHRDNNVEDK